MLYLRLSKMLLPCQKSRVLWFWWEMMNWTRHQKGPVCFLQDAEVNAMLSSSCLCLFVLFYICKIPIWIVLYSTLFRDVQRKILTSSESWLIPNLKNVSLIELIVSLSLLWCCGLTWTRINSQLKPQKTSKLVHIQKPMTITQ